ncbi:MAG: hypothetical protein GC164_03570 [Phycisphaera sp.]|nr:hypothetical protein [Phycisphaera sp.]
MWLNFAENPTPGSPARPTDPSQTQPGAVVEEEEEDLGEEVNTIIVNFVPWTIAVLFHVALVILAYFIIWTIGAAVPEEEPIIPIATLSPTPGAPMTPQVQKTMSQSSARRSVTKAATQSTAQLTSKVTANTELIGALGGATSASNPFGVGVGNGSNFKASFYGTGGNAKRLVYLVDASGSLIDMLPFVIVELKRSISELSDAQEFSVIFFRDGEAVEAPPPGLKKADSQTKQRLSDWITLSAGNVEAHGRSSPITALQRALRYKPQLLFILSDNITGTGQGGSRYEIRQRDLLAEIQKANTGGTKINTIQFLYPDPLAEQGMEPTLKAIADSTGGVYKFLDARALNLE